MDTGQRNNVMAGTFLLVAIALGLYISYKLGDYDFRAKTEYVVHFTLDDGASGLAEGSVVKIGGFEVGEVSNVDLYPEVGRPERVEVGIKINSKYELYSNAVVNLEKPLLGSLSTINIPDVGQPGVRDEGDQADSDGDGSGREPGVLLAAGDSLEGTIAKPAVIEDSGFGGLLEKAEGILDTVTEVLDEVDKESVRAMVEDAKEAIAGARAFVDDFDGKGEEWAASIDTTMENVEGFSGRLDPFMNNLDDGVGEGRQALSSAQEILDDAKPKVSDTLTNVRDVSVTFKDDTLPTINRTVEDSEQFVGDLRVLLRQQRPNIERTLANFRIVSDQAKLISMEIRAQPWRVLFRPDTKEFESQLLYDSARSFAVAASDLRAASELLDAAAAEPGGAIDPETMDRYRRELSLSLEKFQQAEDQLLERIIRSK